MTDKMRSEFEEWAVSENYNIDIKFDADSSFSYRSGLTSGAWTVWQACAARMVPALHAEQIRVAAVAAIREVTGCPDIKGNDGAYLVDALIVNLLSAAPEGKK